MRSLGGGFGDLEGVVLVVVLVEGLSVDLSVVLSSGLSVVLNVVLTVVLVKASETSVLKRVTTRKVIEGFIFAVVGRG